MTSADSDHIYVYLNFTEKLTPNIFTNKMFFRVANLNKPNPLVQINDLVFKGSFDDCVGTNLFFEEVEDPPIKSNLFERETGIRLKPAYIQSKIINLTQMKMPRQMMTKKPYKETVDLNLNQDYNIVLEKLGQGILNLEDLSKNHEEGVSRNKEIKRVQSKNIPEIEKEESNTSTPQESSSATFQAKLDRLKRLAKRPVKRVETPQTVEDCEPYYRASYEYHNLERQFLQSSDYFRTVSSPIIRDTLEGGVDIDRCVLHGLLKPSTQLKRILTKEEQTKVLTLGNLDNLSIPARYLVLKQCVQRMEELIENSPKTDLEDMDEHGRSIIDVCDIFRRLTSALEREISPSNNIQEVQSKKIRLQMRTDEEEYIKHEHDFELDVPDLFDVNEWIEENKHLEPSKPPSSDEAMDAESEVEEMEV